MQETTHNHDHNHNHDHKDCGHANIDSDIVLETKLISQNLELTMSPNEDERTKANQFMDHFFKREDSIKVLLQVIVINKEFRIRQVAAINIQDFLTRSIKFEIDYAKAELAFMEGLIISTVLDFNIQIKVEGILLDTLMEIYSAKKWRELTKDTILRSFKYIRTGEAKKMRVGFAMLENLTRKVSEKDYEEYCNSFLDELILVGHELVKKTSEFYPDNEKSLIDTLDAVQLFQSVLQRMIKRCSRLDILSVILKLHRMEKFIDLCHDTFSLSKITQYSSRINKERKLSSDGYEVPNPDCVDVKKLIVLKNCYRITKYMVATMLPKVQRDEFGFKRITVSEVPFKEGMLILGVVIKDYSSMNATLNILNMLYSEYFSSFDDNSAPVKKMVLAAFQLMDVFTCIFFETVDFDEDIFISFSSQVIQMTYTICYQFLRFTAKDMNNLILDANYVLENINDIVGSCDNHVYRSTCAKIIHRLAKKSDSGMGLILCSCFMTLEKNMNLGMMESLKEEFQHLEVDESLHLKGQNDQQRAALISSALLIISNLSEFWKEREDILQKVMSLIKFMSKNCKDMGGIGREDKLVVCLVLTLIDNYVVILSTGVSQDEEEDASSAVEAENKQNETIPMTNMKTILDYVFHIMNDKNVSNSCYLFSLNVIKGILEKYGEKRENRMFKFNLKKFILFFYRQLLRNFTEMTEVRYFEQVILFFKVFKVQISKKVPDEYIQKFLKGLKTKIEEEIDSCQGEMLQDSTILSLCLDTLAIVCKNDKVYGLFPQEIDSLLKILCQKLLNASGRDSEIECLMLDMLTEHWYATGSFCDCHKEALTSYVMKLGNNGDGNVLLDGHLLSLLNAYCNGQKIWYGEFGRYIADNFRNSFLQKMVKIGVFNVKEGANKSDAQLIVSGVLLLQSIVQNFKDHLQDSEVVELIKSTTSMIGSNLKKKNAAFTSSLMLIFNFMIAYPQLTAKTLHETFNLRTLVELLQANIVTMTKHSYERKCIFHGLLSLFSSMSHEDCNKTGINRYEFFIFLARFLYLHKLLEEFETLVKPKVKREIILNVVGKGKEAQIDLNSASQIKSRDYIQQIMEVMADPRSKKKLTEFEKANVLTINRLMTELTKGQVLDMTYEYSRPYEIEGLNEISLNLEEEEDNIYRANGDVCDDDSDSDYEGFREFDFDAAAYEEVLDNFKSPLDHIDEFLHYRKSLDEFKDKDKQSLVSFFENISGDDYSTFLALKGVKKVSLSDGKVIPRRLFRIKRGQVAFK